MADPLAAAENVANSRPGLSRDLGLGASMAIVVGTIIGSGIFRVPSTMTLAVGSPKIVFLAWLVGGVLSFFGALTYAELGALKPEAGGEYIYVRDGYGPALGFLYAWTWFVIAKPASIATITTGLTDALSALPHFGFLASRFAGLRYAQWIAIAATILISLLNYLGVKRAGMFQVIFTSLKVAMIIGVALIGFSYAQGSWGNFATSIPPRSTFMAALVAALWAYDGWNDLNMVAGEVREPRRNVPIALIGGVAIVGALYVAMNAAIQYVLPASAVAAAKSPASAMTQAVLGPGGAAIITIGIALSMLVTLNGTVLSGSRIPFAVARDGYFFDALANVSPRFRTPSIALLAQAVLAILLLLAAAGFKQLLELAIFAEWLFYMIAASTVFIFRKREPDAERRFRVWGYPFVPALFIAASALLLYSTFMESAKSPFIGTTPSLFNSLAFAGLLVIVAGWPVYALFARRRRQI